MNLFIRSSLTVLFTALTSGIVLADSTCSLSVVQSDTDAKGFGDKTDPKVPMITTERAYTSPIWYNP